MPKTLRNTLIAVFGLLFIFVGGGFGYVYLSGEETSKSDTVLAPTESKTTGMPKPHKPAPNAPVSASIQSLTTPVKTGANSAVTVKTLAGANCNISVVYNNIPSKDSGLVPKTANDFGIATWSWTVDSSAPSGRWPVKITCTYGNKSAYVEGNLEVIGSSVSKVAL